MTRIIGQEANHARNFVEVNALLARRYPKVARFDADAKAYFAKHAEADSLKRRVGYTAGDETFTFLAGLIILDNYQEWLEDSGPVMKAMWVWHQAEEVEHGSVAFNVYKHLYGEHDLYRKWMVLYALVHIALETVRGYVHMARLEGWLRNPVKAVSTMKHGSDPGWVDEALIEFTGEGVHAPALILRQGRWKYVYCEGDPGMLFDLQQDPSELHNLCTDPAFADQAQGFVDQIEQRYKPAQIKQQVLASQRRRLFLHGALTQGTHTPWDYQVRKDGSRQYVRSVSTTSTTATKAKARFPFVPTAPPDTPRSSGT